MAVRSLVGLGRASCRPRAEVGRAKVSAPTALSYQPSQQKAEKTECGPSPVTPKAGQTATLCLTGRVRPWAMRETDEQRLDVFNGLLLAPHLDALLDAGLLTVGDDGLVLLAAELTLEQRKKLGLSEVMSLTSLRPEHLEYLHRRHVWRSSKTF